MTTTTHLSITDLVEGQRNAATAVNAAFQILDSAVQLWVNNAAPSTTPPASGVENGHSYIVPASATGDWSGHDDKVAVWQSGWTFLVPRHGWRCWDATGARLMTFLGLHGVDGRWQAFQAARQAALGTMATPTTFGECQTNDQTLADKINNIMAAMITAGLMAGDALTAEVINEAVGVTETTVDLLNP